AVRPHGPTRSGGPLRDWTYHAKKRCFEPVVRAHRFRRRLHSARATAARAARSGGPAVGAPGERDASGRHRDSAALPAADHAARAPASGTPAGAAPAGGSVRSPDAGLRPAGAVWAPRALWSAGAVWAARPLRPAVWSARRALRAAVRSTAAWLWSAVRAAAVW